MNKELTVSEINGDKVLAEIKNTDLMCRALLESPHYKRMGAEGIYAIVTKARSVGVNPMDALNGGMYYVQGKVEMTSAMMNQMIRQMGHSVTKDKRSDENICILHGKRRDNGDTWVESFSIEDAKKAGIYKNQWLKYPKDMLFARALSRLARQLFPDVIKGCYVQGEIAEAPALYATEEEEILPTEISLAPSAEITITEEQHQELEEWLGDNIKLRQNILVFLKKKYGVETLRDMPPEIYDMAITRAQQQRRESEEAYGEQQQVMGA